ncbi:MAG: AAA family ATPase [Clostridiales bacterium]|nr:AAA family ATPase [Clostridiales bacterium]
MKIKSLHLENYRCFKNFDIDFNDRLTVLVGANGAGKTATLDALSIFLKWAGHPKIRNTSFDYLEMPLADIAFGSKLEDISYWIEIEPIDETGFEPRKIEFKRFWAASEKSVLLKPLAVRDVITMLNASSPIFTSYMAGRFINESDSIMTHEPYRPLLPNEFVAFENSFSRTIDFASTLSWFYDADADEARNMRDNGQKDESPELMAVREALSKSLLGQYEKPRMSGHPSELIIYRKGTSQAYKIGQLSDGYRTMLALVLDLARRMAQAHGADTKQAESPLSAPAIVLIDEVELHLHPAWQQTILTTLMDIFPNTQFIATTHSPQVLTSIPQEHIRILSCGKAYTVSEQTQGAEAQRLLKNVFGVDLRPRGLDIVQILKTYTDLVYAEQWDTPEAEELKRKLNEHYGNDEPALMELELHIENSKWEREL